MRQVTVVYHQEAEGWWAESADLPTFTAVADTLAETRGLVREGMAFHIDEPIDLMEASSPAGGA